MAETTRAEDDEVELRCRKEDGKEFLKKAPLSAKKLDRAAQFKLFFENFYSATNPPNLATTPTVGHSGISALPPEIGAFVNLKMLDCARAFNFQIYFQNSTPEQCPEIV